MRVRGLYRIKLKLEAFRKLHKGELSILDEIDPVLRLIRVPITAMGDRLRDIDAQLANIEAAFSDCDATCDLLIEFRNQAHVDLSGWSHVIERWRQLDPNDENTNRVIDMIRTLYRFLAERYLQADEWELMISEEQDKPAPHVMNW